MKILVVEDDAVSRRLLHRSLEKWGHEVISVVNGAEALSTLKGQDFEIIITDWIMPEVDGLELVRRIREMERPEYIYVIMLTYKSHKEDLISGMNAGADDFLAKPFDPDELRVRVRAGARIVDLERKLMHRNVELNTANNRMKRDLEIAAAIQKSLLPEEAPEIQNTHFAWLYEPCEELAGDILNIFELEDSKIGLYVLDVSGHGVAAALLSVTLSRMLSPKLEKTSLLRYAVSGEDCFRVSTPVSVAEELNSRFQIEMNNEQFFTLLYGVYDCDTRELTYVSAGHPGLVHIPYRKDAYLIEAPSLPIGFAREHRYREQTIHLEPGDRLYIYSDGIVEARDRKHQLFGTRRMLDALDGATGLPLQDSLALLVRKVEQWCRSKSLSDDVSLLAMEVRY